MSDLQTHTNGLAPDHGTIINQANSQHSTGPRTAAGKQRSSLNALRHGLTGHVIVLPSEDHTAYEAHTQRFLKDLQPKGALETQLVQSLADTSWRLNRVAALETNLIRSGPVTLSPVPRPKSPVPAASMHEHRLSRQFERALNQLREIQAERREQEEKQLQGAAELLQMDQDAGLSFEPTEDGFVFSNDEIETFIRRRDRRREAWHADGRRMSA